MNSKKLNVVHLPLEQDIIGTHPNEIMDSAPSLEPMIQRAGAWIFKTDLNDLEIRLAWYREGHNCGRLNPKHGYRLICRIIDKITY